MIRHYMTRTVLCALLFSSPLFPATDSSVTVDGTTYHKPQAPAMAQTPTGAKVCYGVAAFMAVTGGLGFAYTQWKEDRAAEKYAEIVDWVDAQPIGSLKLHDFKRMNEAAKAYRKAKTWKKVALGVLGGAVVPAAVGAGIQWYNANKITGAYKKQHTAWQDAVRKNTARERLRCIREKQYVLARAGGDDGVRRLRTRDAEVLMRALKSNELTIEQKRELARQAAALHPVGSVAWAEALAGTVEKTNSSGQVRVDFANVTSDNFIAQAQQFGAASEEQVTRMRATQAAALAQVQPTGDDFDQFRAKDKPLLSQYQASRKVIKDVETTREGIVRELAEASEEQKPAIQRGLDLIDQQLVINQQSVEQRAEALLRHRIAFAQQLRKEGRNSDAAVALAGGTALQKNASSVWQGLVLNAPQPMREWAMSVAGQEAVSTLGNEGAAVRARLALEKKVNTALVDIEANKERASKKSVELVVKEKDVVAQQKNFLANWFSLEGDNRNERLQQLQQKHKNKVQELDTLLDEKERLLTEDQEAIARLDDERDREQYEREKDITGRRKEIEKIAEQQAAEQLWSDFFAAELEQDQEAPAATVSRRMRFARELCPHGDQRHMGVLLGGLLDAQSIQQGAQLLAENHATAAEQLAHFLANPENSEEAGFKPLQADASVETDSDNSNGWGQQTKRWVDTARKKRFDDDRNRFNDLADVTGLQTGQSDEQLGKVQEKSIDRVLSRTCPEFHQVLVQERAAANAPQPKDYRHRVNLEFYEQRLQELLPFLRGSTNEMSSALYMLKRNEHGQIVDGNGNAVVLAPDEYVEVSSTDLSTARIMKRGKKKFTFPWQEPKYASSQPVLDGRGNERTFQPVLVINQEVVPQDSEAVAVEIAAEINRDQHRRLASDGYTRSMQCMYVQHAEKAFALLKKWAKEKSIITPAMREELNVELAGMMQPHHETLAAGQRYDMHTLHDDAHALSPEDRVLLTGEIQKNAQELAALVVSDRYGVEIKPALVPNYHQRLSEHAAAFKNAEVARIQAHNAAIEEALAKPERDPDELLPHRLSTNNLHKVVKREVENTKERFCNEEFIRRCNKYRNSVMAYKMSSIPQDPAQRTEQDNQLVARLNVQLPQFNQATAGKEERKAYLNAVHQYCGAVLNNAEHSILVSQRFKERRNQSQAQLADYDSLVRNHRDVSWHLSHLFSRMYRDVMRRCNGHALTKLQARIRGDQSRTNALGRRRAAMAIQSLFRGHQVRRAAAVAEDGAQ